MAITDNEIADTDLSSDALTPEELAYEQSRGGEVETPAAKEPAAPEPKAEEPKSEPPAEAEPSQSELQSPDGKQKWVPHGALAAERAEKAEAVRRARDLELQLARLQGQQEALKPADPNAPAKAPGLDEIDIEKEPIKAIAALKAEIAARKQAEEQSHAVQSIITTGQTYCRKFAEAEPQFFGTLGADGKQQEGAYQFLRRSSAERLAQQGVPAHEVEQAVNLAEIRLINETLAQGLDPARAMWHWAQVAGFKPQSAAAPAAERAPNGQFQAKPPSEAEKIVTAEKAQAASKSLSSAPGGTGGPGLTMDALADMSDEEFAEATKGGKWEKLHRSGVL